MNIAILILENVFKSVAYDIEELFFLNNIHCKEKDEIEIKTTFVSFEDIKPFECEKPSNFIFDVVIIPPIIKDYSEIFVSDKIIDWLIYQYNNKSILTSSCVGSFILAKTGLLDNKSATTNWAYEELFKKEFPNINLDIDKILVDEKNIITAGGINAYLDLCLYIVEKIHSNKTATQLANFLKNLRVEKAKELLISSNKSFSDITLEVGYFDENSFRKFFKKETSLNPKDFRKRFQQSMDFQK